MQLKLMLQVTHPRQICRSCQIMYLCKGVQNMPLQNKPLWHIDNFELKILKKTTDAEGLSDLLFSTLKQVIQFSMRKFLFLHYYDKDSPITGDGRSMLKWIYTNKPTKILYLALVFPKYFLVTFSEFISPRSVTSFSFVLLLHNFIILC